MLAAACLLSVFGPGVLKKGLYISLFPTSMFSSSHRTISQRGNNIHNLYHIIFHQFPPYNYHTMCHKQSSPTPCQHKHRSMVATSRTSPYSTGRSGKSTPPTCHLDRRSRDWASVITTVNKPMCSEVVDWKSTELGKGSESWTNPASVGDIIEDFGETARKTVETTSSGAQRVWYCCNCPQISNAPTCSGPWLSDLYEACIECSHVKCNMCREEHVTGSE